MEKLTKKKLQTVLGDVEIPFRVQAAMNNWHVPKYLGKRYICSFYDGAACSYCKRIMRVGSSTHPTLDHVIPKSRGGTSEQVTVVCCECNSKKGDLSVVEFLRRISP
jgi:5-methylcytosine-specific restriction endonuclease McrA